MRVGFEERHHKCLHEAVDLIPPSSEKARPDGVQEESEREIPSIPIPLSGIPEFSGVLPVEEEASSIPGGVSSSAAPVEGISVLNEISASASPSPVGMR